MVDLERVISESEKEMSDEHTARDVRSFCFRGGNASCMLEDGGIIGKCPRKLLIQWVGLPEKPKDLTSQMMIAIGNLNETMVINHLDRKGIQYDHERKLTSNIGGVSLSVRPDLVFIGEDGHYTNGMELKCVASHYVANSVGLADTIKAEHLSQCAIAIHLLGNIPYQLAYFNYSIYDAMYYLKTRYNNKELVVKPFRIYYDLAFNANGKLCYSNTAKNQTVETAITLEGVFRNYKYIQACEKTKTLPDLFKITKRDSFGEKAKTNPCSKCDMKDICEDARGDYETFIALYKEATA
jgi:hypothetical protein